MAEEKKEAIQLHAAETMEFMQYIIRPVKELERAMNDRFCKVDEMMDALEKRFKPFAEQFEKLEKLLANHEATQNKHNIRIGDLFNKTNGLENLWNFKKEMEAELQKVKEKLPGIDKAHLDIKVLQGTGDLMMKQQAKMMEIVDHDKKHSDDLHSSHNEKLARMEAKQKQDVDVLLNKMEKEAIEMEDHNQKHIERHNIVMQQMNAMNQMQAHNKRELDRDVKDLFKKVDEEVVALRAEMNLMKEGYLAETKKLAADIDEFRFLPKEVKIMDKRIESTFQLVKEIRVHLKI